MVRGRRRRRLSCTFCTEDTRPKCLCSISIAWARRRANNTLLRFFFIFLLNYVIVLLFCVKQWVASIDGNLPFWPPSYVIKHFLLLCICGYGEQTVSLSLFRININYADITSAAKVWSNTADVFNVSRTRQTKAWDAVGQPNDRVFYHQSSSQWYQHASKLASVLELLR